MFRLAALLSMLILGACDGATPAANVGMSFGPNGLRVAPSVGVYGANASVLVHP